MTNNNSNKSKKASNKPNTKEQNKKLSSTQNNSNQKRNPSTKNTGYRSFQLDKDPLLSPLQKIDSYYRGIFSSVDSFITRELFVDSNVRLLLAVSGGIDSIVMLDIMANLAVDKNFELVIAHYDHQLREESHKDSEFVKRVAKKYNIEFVIEKGDVESYAKQNKLSLEEAARKKRYQFFEKVAREKQVNFVATAHNANDSTETFFINLFRGSGLTGLGGIPQKRGFYKNINIIRPIIIFNRKEIENYAEKRKLRWREDETNKDNSFVRNKIRNHLLPILEDEYVKDLYNVINRSARMINAADRFIYTRIKPSLDDVIVRNGKGFIILDLRRLNLFEDFIKRELIAMSLNKYMNIYDISYNKLMGLADLFHSQSGKEFIINENIIAHKDRNELVIFKKDIFKKFTSKLNLNTSVDLYGEQLTTKSISRKVDIILTDNPNIEYVSKQKLNGALEIRPVTDGDRFKPIGMMGRSMKISDYLVNNKVDFLTRKRALVLTNNGEIVWLIGHRVSEEYKLSENARTAIKLEYKQSN